MWRRKQKWERRSEYIARTTLQPRWIAARCGKRAPATVRLTRRLHASRNGSPPPPSAPRSACCSHQRTVLPRRNGRCQLVLAPIAKQARCALTARSSPSPANAGLLISNLRSRLKRRATRTPGSPRRLSSTGRSWRSIVTLWPRRWGLRQSRRKGRRARCTFRGWIGWSVADASVLRRHSASRVHPKILLGVRVIACKKRDCLVMPKPRRYNLSQRKKSITWRAMRCIVSCPINLLFTRRVDKSS